MKAANRPHRLAVKYQGMPSIIRSLANKPEKSSVLSIVRRDWLMIVLMVASLLPIWLFRYIPTQNGPSHIYNSHFLREYLNPAYNFSQVNSDAFLRPIEE